jgi:hypothetical protein
LGGDAAIEALSGKGRELEFDHIEPRSMNRGIEPVKAVSEGKGFGWG